MLKTIGPASPVYLLDPVTGNPVPTGQTRPSSDSGPSWPVLQTQVTSADATAGVDILPAPAAGNTAIIDDLVISAAVEMTVTVQMATSGNDLLRLYLPATAAIQVTLRNGLRADNDAEAVEIVASVAGNVAVTTSYHLEA